MAKFKGGISVSQTPQGRLTAIDGYKSAGIQNITMRQSFMNKRRKRMRDSSHGSDKDNKNIDKAQRKR